MAGFEFVDVKGVGRLPKRFDMEFDGVNFERQETANGHNEARVDVFQGHDRFFDDDFNVSGVASGGKYQVDIDISSEVNVGFFWNGRVTLVYDATSRHWSMKAKASNREWLFCDPQAVVHAVVAGLQFYARDEEAREAGLGETAARLATSISNDAAAIAQTAPLYDRREDCSAPPLSERDDDDVPVPMY